MALMEGLSGSTVVTKIGDVPKSLERVATGGRQGTTGGNAEAYSLRMNLRWVPSSSYLLPSELHGGYSEQACSNWAIRKQRPKNTSKMDAEREQADFEMEAEREFRRCLCCAIASGDGLLAVGFSVLSRLKFSSSARCVRAVYWPCVTELDVGAI